MKARSRRITCFSYHFPTILSQLFLETGYRSMIPTPVSQSAVPIFFAVPVVSGNKSRRAGICRMAALSIASRSATACIAGSAEWTDDRLRRGLERAARIPYLEIVLEKL